MIIWFPGVSDTPSFCYCFFLLAFWWWPLYNKYSLKISLSLPWWISHTKNQGMPTIQYFCNAEEVGEEANSKIKRKKLKKFFQQILWQILFIDFFLGLKRKNFLYEAAGCVLLQLNQTSTAGLEEMDVAFNLLWKIRLQSPSLKLVVLLATCKHPISVLLIVKYSKVYSKRYLCTNNK